MNIESYIFHGSTDDLVDLENTYRPTVHFILQAHRNMPCIDEFREILSIFSSGGAKLSSS